jgi:nickel transport system substrate-binding protein
MIRKLFTALIAFVVAMVSLAGCASSPPGDQAGTDSVKTITIAESNNFVGGFASIYGPEQGSSMSYYYYVGNFYEPLVKYEEGEVVPCLAKEWTISEDGLVYSFDLEEGVLFSDGTELTAEIVKLNLMNTNTILGASAAN